VVKAVKVRTMILTVAVYTVDRAVIVNHVTTENKTWISIVY